MYNMVVKMDDKEGSRQVLSRLSSLLPRSGKRRALFLSLALLVIIIAVLLLEYMPRSGRFEVGKPSMETIISSKDLSVVDEEGTDRAREAERQRIRGYFIERGAQAESISAISEFFGKAEELAAGDESLDAKIGALARFDPEVDTRTIQDVLTSSPDDARVLYGMAVELLTSAMSGPVAYDNIEAVRESIESSAEDLYLEPWIKNSAASLAATFLKPNTPYSFHMIERDMEAASNRVQPVYVNYKTGQKIVDKGEIITPLTLTALDQAGSLSPVGTYQQSLGIVLLLITLYVGAVLFFNRFRPDIAGNWRVVAMICLVFLVFCLLCRLFSVFADENLMWGYLIPLAVVGLTLAVLLDHLVALFMVTMGGIITGLIVKGNFYLMVTAILGGIAAIILVTRFQQRERLFRVGAGLSISIAIVSMITAGLIKDFHSVAVAGGLGLANGMLSMVLTLGSFPVLEKISGIITPIHLLELASPSHPLMKELITKAPGTYSHSVIVGNLADAAARETGADPLLARVGSYYHDIGKLKRSTFFVENQPAGFNGHQNIKPNLSALIITAHVREGVEIAREYKIPQEVTDIIGQHHGTSLVRYFYTRALEENTGEGSVSESRFRYPGEKPRSKEAAIVMLADAIEAAAKALYKPTPVKLEQLSQSLIKERLEDGQLSASPLTLDDLEKIGQTFVRILSAMYHERIEYPALNRAEVI
ncbi:MAG: hypothetical protein A2W01_04550 [Candidatus Solincola sediminis]|uniref:HD/PDEase domain-containing protein n=1 Tax=Candidatus Solincola sediminis TaxID=1797199 RepID=A0A1F2WGM2_9ACTN|nr:MAG: hypothetical protein A2Y75_04625 [Candidatus Solincola sediminis]OFW58261.1 MAG: hypothetical protein A2W01_04550 [Candidatus Solincola sediminis]